MIGSARVEIKIGIIVGIATVTETGIGTEIVSETGIGRGIGIGTGIVVEIGAANDAESAVGRDVGIGAEAETEIGNEVGKTTTESGVERRTKDVVAGRAERGMVTTSAVSVMMMMGVRGKEVPRRLGRLGENLGKRRRKEVPKVAKMIGGR